MLAYFVLLLAALSRFVPHAFGGVGLNFTAVGGGLLFFGARRPRPEAVAGLGVMASTDVVLTRFVYHYPFHLTSYLVTWAWYAGVCLLASGLLRQVSPVRVVAAAFGSATSFFVLSNFVVWCESAMYAHTQAGFLSCYTLALPFYANDLVSTGLTATVLFGLPVIAAQVVETWRRATEEGRPLV